MSTKLLASFAARRFQSRHRMPADAQLEEPPSGPGCAVSEFFSCWVSFMPAAGEVKVAKGENLVAGDVR